MGDRMTHNPYSRRIFLGGALALLPVAASA
jgi:hypothetical protein